jgi:hypothetical protein
MGLTRKRMFIIALVGLSVVAYILIEAAIAAKQMARFDLIQCHLGPLGLQVEEYKDKHGNYPESLNALLLDANTESQKVMRQVLQDEFNDDYKYERLSNGFTFTVAGPSSFLVKWDTVRKMYSPGDARKDYNITVTAVTNR